MSTFYSQLAYLLSCTPILDSLLSVHALSCVSIVVPRSNNKSKKSLCRYSTSKTETPFFSHEQDRTSMRRSSGCPMVITHLQPPKRRSQEGHPMNSLPAIRSSGKKNDMGKTTCNKYRSTANAL